MSCITEKVALRIKSKGITLSKMSRDTKIPYNALYSSIGDGGRGRDLRDDEFIAICAYADINPMELVGKGKTEELIV